MKLSRISTLGILASIVAVIPGLLTAPASPSSHMGLVGLGAGLLFPTAMYITFTGSLKSGLPRKGLEAIIPLLSVTLAGLTLPLYMAGSPVWMELSMLSLALLGAHTLVQLRGWKRREPRVPLLYPPLAGAVAAACECGLYEWMLRLALFYAVPMVIVVSLFTVSRNYGVDPSRPIVYAPLALNFAALTASIVGSWYIPLAAAGILLYFLVLRAWMAPRIILRGLRIGGPGGGALVYMGVAHLASMVSQLLWLAGLDLLSLIHVVFIGFIGVHIFLHAPLMLPQIVRVRLDKRYMPPLPPALLSAAAIARPWWPTASYILVVLSLASLLIQFRPLGFIRS